MYQAPTAVRNATRLIDAFGYWPSFTTLRSTAPSSTGALKIAPDPMPMWTSFDMTPGGRDPDWYPKLNYRSAQ